MADSRSRKAARLGALVERAAREKYGLVGSHSSWKDAETEDGRPVEVKGALLGRESPRFRVFKKYHRRLEEADGLYCFVAYRIRGRGIRVVRTRTVRACALDLRWGGSGGHRGSLEAKPTPDDIFS